MQTKSFLSLCAIALVSIPLFSACDVDFGFGGHRDGWHRGDWHRVMETNTLVSEVSQNNAQANAARALANKYGIRLSSAKTILNLAGGENQVQTMNNLGLNAVEMVPLASLEMPSKESIQTVAAKLGEDSVKIEKMMSDFISDVKANDKIDKQ